ncbi:hypothetical protein [Halobacterium litoreum]|uniref:DUF7979 domain-containing protein n=1 Tax=Halobacterium litoreum TaxID=2039234 RepID=A0ABD5NDC7_9EURY|nr:hypothetical protein [Halobacterium litoreum]UHH13865.1 hypothetical protein LT972_02440 [Halobacterium litoreum]
MHPTIEATETVTVTADNAVRHFDELDDDAQNALHDAVHGDEGAIPEAAADAFTDGEVVRFTGYYRVDIAQ